MSTLALIGVAGAVAASALHVAFWWLESITFRRPAVWSRFGVESQRDADVIAPMAFNQGFYNLFIAIGTLVGVVILLDGDTQLGWSIMLFGCGMMVGAAFVLASTTFQLWRAAVMQGGPPLVCIVTGVFALT
ncbi:MAG: DUF1304 domain-containing protein [Thermoleophilia bacterium]|nr:DUF1304 domain-containing protein [Thermoleophilia bacterium]